MNPSSQVDLPQALIHQAAIVDITIALFSLPDTSISALRRGGSRTLEKLLRSYHYWVVEHPVNKGFCPYNKPRCDYFRMTPNAYAAGLTDPLRCEHTVPINVLRNYLISLRGNDGCVSREDVERVMQMNEIVVVTSEEALKLDQSCLKNDMPTDWSFERPQFCLARLSTGLQVNEQDLKGNRRIGPRSNVTYSL